MISLKIDKIKSRQIQADMFKSADETVRALAAAISDTTKTYRAQASKEIRQTIRLPKKIVDSRIRRLFISRFKGGIEIKDKPISLKHFKPKQTKLGVEYRPYKRGNKVLIPSAFGPKITALHGSVYVRNTASRYPINIKQHFGLISSPVTRLAIAKVEREAQAILEKNIARRMRLIVLRREGKAPPETFKGSKR